MTTNRQDALDRAALATLLTVAKAMRVRGLTRDAAVSLVATAVDESVEQVESLLDRAGLVLAARVRGES